MPDLANLQDLLVRPTLAPRQVVLLFRLGAVAAARGFLRTLLPRIPDGSAAGAAVAEPVHLALGWGGLAKLLPPGLDAATGLQRLEGNFTEDLPDHPSVAPDLGFRGPHDPGGWWQQRFRTGEIELVLHAGFADEASADAGLAHLRGLAQAHGLNELTLPAFPEGALAGYRPDRGILHFGYRDGISKLEVDWAMDGRAPVDCRELVLGYPNDDYAISPVDPGPWQDFVRDGSFLCLAWIHQDVAAFNRFLAETAPTLNLPAGTDRVEWLASRLLGRWRDGSPVMRYPNAAPPGGDPDASFGFAADPNGELCPLNAHIRVVNLRDDPLKFANQKRFPKGPPRLLRRGFSYGPRLEGTVDDGQERGLVGLFCCARINEQFYTVLRWLQATDFADGFFRNGHSEHMQDALLGLDSMPKVDRRLRLWPGTGAAQEIMLLRELIAFRGVGCFFLPSLTSLRRIAA